MNVVFDFGGVVFRWAPAEFMARLLPRRAATAGDLEVLVADFFQSFGGDWGDFDRGTVEAEALAAAIARRTGLELAEARAVIAAVPGELTPIPGTVALLRELHAAGHPLYFLSNMPAPYALHLEAAHEFLGLFQAGVFSARVGLVKPEPAIFAHAAEAFGIAPAESIFIDDLWTNVAAARAAGWQALQFRSPTQCRSRLEALGLVAPSPLNPRPPQETLPSRHQHPLLPAGDGDRGLLLPPAGEGWGEGGDGATALF